jgi:hypothetical protein
MNPDFCTDRRSHRSPRILVRGRLIEPGMTDSCCFYNPSVFYNPRSSLTLPLWKRIAAFLSLVAVLSALVAPAATLAEEVRTGKLGGVCLVNTSADVNGDAAPSGSHCDSCGSLAFALPPFTAQTLPSQPDQQVAGIDLSFDLAARISGLPPSRGPPAL